MPKVSVCIPVYNAEKYIESCIQSVLGQTMQDFEIIVLNNCSTDRTAQLVEEVRDPRVKLFHNDANIGMLNNWNKVMTLANGDYIKVLPADDFLYPKCLELQATVLDNDIEKKVALVCGRKNVINDKNEVLFSRGLSKKDQLFTKKEAINKAIRSGGNPIGEPGVTLFRRELLEKTGLFEGGIYLTIDMGLWFRMLLHGSLYSLGTVICSFRISSGSISVSIANQQKLDFRKFIDKISSNPDYELSALSAKFGKANVSLITLAKKILYKVLT